MFLNSIIFCVFALISSRSDFEPYNPTECGSGFIIKPMSIDMDLAESGIHQKAFIKY